MRLVMAPLPPRCRLVGVGGEPSDQIVVIVIFMVILAMGADIGMAVVVIVGMAIMMIMGISIRMSRRTTMVVRGLYKG
jgi:hypothetical protein